MENPTNHTPDPELVQDLVAFIDTYVATPSDDHSLLLAIYILHTWNINHTHVTPYLYINSKEPSCGKTRLMEVLGVLCCNAQRADDMTPAVMFKLIERSMPTLLIDEVDTVWSGSRNEPKRQILNTGYKRGGCAWREQARELVDFSTFCGKVLAGIQNGFLPRTIADRCIPIEMKKRGDKNIERFVETRVVKTKEYNDLMDRIVAFSEHYGTDIAVMKPEPMVTLSDRQDEISEPLLQIAAVLGIEDEARECIERIFMTASKVAPSPTQAIFQRIWQAFDENETDRLFSEDICASLGPMYATGRALALFLEPYGIEPKNVRVANRVARGYSLSQFADAFSNHLGLKPADTQIEEEVEA